MTEEEVTEFAPDFELEEAADTAAELVAAYLRVEWQF